MTRPAAAAAARAQLISASSRMRCYADELRRRLPLPHCITLLCVAAGRHDPTARLRLECAQLWLQVERAINLWPTASVAEAACFAVICTRSVAEAPYAQRRLRHDMRLGHSRREARSRDDGDSTWVRQLRQLARVSPAVAQCIAAHYASPRALLDAYARCRSTADAQALLSRLPVPTTTGVQSRPCTIGATLSGALLSPLRMLRFADARWQRGCIAFSPPPMAPP